MDFRWTGAGWPGTFGIKADYAIDSLDAAPPIDTLWIDRSLDNVSAEIKLLVGVLCFGPYAGTVVKLDQPVNRETAYSVGHFLKSFGSDTVVENVTDVPKAIWPANGCLVVGEAEDLPSRRMNNFEPGAESHNFYLNLYDSSEFSGFLSNAHEAHLATNAMKLADFSKGRIPRIRTKIATALLCIQDLHLSTVHYMGALDESELLSIRSLLRGAGIGLKWSPAATSGK